MLYIGLAMLFLQLTPQQPQMPRQTPRTPVLQHQEFTWNLPTDTPTSLDGKDYKIGRDDLLEISVFEVAELGAIIRVSATGMISLPLIGQLAAIGETTDGLGALIEAELKKKYVNDPHVTVFVREYASQPVSVVGAVRVPGIYQLKGQKSLLDVLASAQGLSEAAGNEIHVIRRAPPDGSSGDNQTKQLLTINVEELMQKGKTDLNIPIYAGDVINVLNAGSVFVVGEVLRPGEFPLRYGRNVTISQALALGGGLSKYAKKKEGVVIRYHADGTKEEIAVNIEKLLQRGSSNIAADVLMQPNDILFIPSSNVRTGFSKALDSAVMIAVGRAIYHY